MNWLNAREKMPAEGDKIWILTKESQKGFTIRLGEVRKDQIGLKYVEIYEHNQYDYDLSDFYFYAFDYMSSMEGWDPSWPRDKWDDRVIWAWKPFDESDIPSFGYITTKECMNLIMELPAYKQEKERRLAARNKTGSEDD